MNLTDGRRLGKVCDVVFSWPEGRVQGIVVPGGRGFRFGKADLFIDLKSVRKIGVDTILVELKAAPKPDKRKGKWEECPPTPEPPPFYRGGNERRDFGEYE